MSKIKFLTTCPGCKDEHLGIECKKPSYVMPTITKSLCDECESTVLLQVSLPKGRTDRRTIQISPMKITISPKLAQILLEEELKLATIQEESAVQTMEKTNG